MQNYYISTTNNDLLITVLGSLISCLFFYYVKETGPFSTKSYVLPTIVEKQAVEIKDLKTALETVTANNADVITTCKNELTTASPDLLKLFYDSTKYYENINVGLKVIFLSVGLTLFLFGSYQIFTVYYNKKKRLFEFYENFYIIQMETENNEINFVNIKHSEDPTMNFTSLQEYLESLYIRISLQDAEINNLRAQQVNLNNTILPDNDDMSDNSIPSLMQQQNEILEDIFSDL